MHCLPSGLRSVDPESTVRHAVGLASRLGISRVTDISRLDRIGIPVFTSVRPTAARGSLCVTAGKGIRLEDARAGAYMEAIEFALAEPHASSVDVEVATARHVLDGVHGPAAVLDFCPRAQRSVDPDVPLGCVRSTDIVSGRQLLVPAELVFLPYPHGPGTGIFGSSSNGLASGNTVEEATLHGLLEVIERDIRAFHRIRDKSRPLHPSTLPGIALEQLAKIGDAGFEWCVRYLPNEFDLPCFEALIWDASASNALKLAAGYGCHLMRDIALTRAVTEAVQSRLSWIHGARDDLVEPDTEVGDFASPELEASAALQWQRYTDVSGGLDFERVPGLGLPRSIDDALFATMERLARSKIRLVCRVAFTPSIAKLQVVRVIVPRLEYWDRFSHRIGPRLHAFIRQRS